MSNWVKDKTLNNGKYTIKKILGEGGFGITYLAEENNKRKVAIKTLKPEIQQRSDFDKFEQRFLEEAKRLSICQHNNIVIFYDLIQEDGLYCIVMEYIDGEDLETFVNKQGSLQESIALKYIEQIGEALKVVHSQGILHRDVKPKNIMLRKDQSEVVLIDLGIARDFTPNQTNSHTPFVSDIYAPIEQYFRKQRTGEYTDVYALATTLYVLLTGCVQTASGQHYQLPRSIDRTDELNNFRADPLVPPNKINPNISKMVNQAILKGMALDPKKRPKTVQEWLNLLGSNPTMSEAGTIKIPGIKPLYTAAVTNFSNIAKNTDLRPWLIGVSIFIFGLVMFNLPSGGDSSRKHNPSHEKPASSSSETPVNLVQIDYNPLQSLLQSKRFEDADRETLRVMLLLANRQKEKWFDVENIKNISCTDLSKINRLWLRYSDGRFGFSVQRKLWIEMGGQSGVYNVEIADSFIERVGWGNKDKRYDNITYDLSAPVGHLPFRVTSSVWKFGTPYLAERLTSCKIPQ